MTNKRPMNNGIILCLSDTRTGLVEMYKSNMGIFEKAGTYTEEQAEKQLARYERQIALMRMRGDAFSGLYLHKVENKDLIERFAEDED